MRGQSQRRRRVLLSVPWGAEALLASVVGRLSPLVKRSSAVPDVESPGDSRRLSVGRSTDCHWKVGGWAPSPRCPRPGIRRYRAQWTACARQRSVRTWSCSSTALVRPHGSPRRRVSLPNNFVTFACKKVLLEVHGDRTIWSPGA
jgi:hypothetical protein